MKVLKSTLNDGRIEDMATYFTSAIVEGQHL